MNNLTSDKKSVALLAEIFAGKGLEHIVISPGSRNAPLIISFAGHPDIKAFSIVDERSAAFFALGIAQKTGKTVAIACTSGTAALNYAPAIAEAYYQGLPLLVLTADRPPELIDTGEGQTIRQKNIFSNYIKASFEAPVKVESPQEIEEAALMFNEAIDITMTPSPGPVHINMPFDEPLYETVERKSFDIKITPPPEKKNHIGNEQITKLVKIWNSTPGKLIIAGMMNENPTLSKLLQQLSFDKSVFILSETISNINDNVSCTGIDKIVSTIEDSEAGKFKPGLLITFGGHIVSKMIKKFLRNHKPDHHWHIDLTDNHIDTFGCLTGGINTTPEYFFSKLLPLIKPVESDFNEIWRQRSNRSEQRHSAFLKSAPYSDLTVFEFLLKNIPEDSDLHLGNSTPVRYAQLFKPAKKLNYYCNRGVSGIDGTVSTATGAAFYAGKPTTLITGDLAFLYDSNALMNSYLSANLRIIIINNSGGGIFRFIPGPGQTGFLEKFFEATHNYNMKLIAENFNIPYFEASSMKELQAVISEFYSESLQKAAILEIFTPKEVNAAVLKNYFKFLSR